MDTSKTYYESVMRDFAMYARGRSLEQYCREEAVIKILHYTVTGYEMYTKWFDDGKAMKPEFSKMKSSHTITRSQLLLLLNGAVKPTLKRN